jgi:hypothetical protein
MMRPPKNWPDGSSSSAMACVPAKE